MGPVLVRSKHVIGKCPQRRFEARSRKATFWRRYKSHMQPMVLEYAHQHLPWKSPSFVGKYSIHGYTWSIWECYFVAILPHKCWRKQRWLDDIIPSTNSKKKVWLGWWDYHTISTVEHQNNIENQQHAWNHESNLSIFPNIISPVNHHFHWLDHVKSQFLQNSTSCCPGSKKHHYRAIVLVRFAHFDWKSKLGLFHHNSEPRPTYLNQLTYPRAW